MSLDKRIDQLEASLTPEQILMRWLNATLKFESREEYALWAAKDPSTRGAVATFIRDLVPQSAMKPRETAAAWRKRLLEAAEYLVYGYHLFVEVNETLERQSSFSMAAIGLKYELEQLENDLVANLMLFELIPVPVVKEVAATIQTALDNYVSPLRDFAREVKIWMRDYCTETTANGAAAVSEQRLAKSDEIGRATFSGDALKGWWVELSPFPYRSLGTAALVDGRWIDRRLVEQAEFAALLVSRGFRLLERPDVHPLEPLFIMNNAGRPASEEELLPLRKETEQRLQLFKGKNKKIRRNIFVDIDDYRSWTGRTVVGELNPMRGIDVACWNQWLDSIGGEGRAEIAGVKLRRLRAPFSPSDLVICQDETEFVARSQARFLLQEKIHQSASGGPEVATERNSLREAISATLRSLLASRSLVEQIEELFNGHPVIFNATAEQHGSMIMRMEELVSEFNTMCSMSGSDDSRIDLDSVFVSAKSQSENALNQILEMARARTLATLGRREGARRVLGEIVAKIHAPSSDDARSTHEPKDYKSKGLSPAELSLESAQAMLSSSLSVETNSETEF